MVNKMVSGHKRPGGGKQRMLSAQEAGWGRRPSGKEHFSSELGDGRCARPEGGT